MIYLLHNLNFPSNEEFSPLLSSLSPKCCATELNKKFSKPIQTWQGVTAQRVNTKEKFRNYLAGDKITRTNLLKRCHVEWFVKISWKAMICVILMASSATSDTQSSSVQPSKEKEAFVDLVERV